MVALERVHEKRRKKKLVKKEYKYQLTHVFVFASFLPLTRAFLPSRIQPSQSRSSSIPKVLRRVSREKYLIATRTKLHKRGAKKKKFTRPRRRKTLRHQKLVKKHRQESANTIHFTINNRKKTQI